MLALSYLLLLVASAIGSLYAPASAVAAVICMFGLEQWGQASGSPLAAGAAFTNIAVGVMVLAALATRILRAQRLFNNVPAAYWFVCALFVYAFMSVLWTPDPETAFANWNHAYPYVVTIIFLTPLLCGESRDFVTGLRWLVVLGGAVSCLVLFFGNWGHRGLIIDPAMFDIETNPLAVASMAGQVAMTALLVPISKSKVLRWATIGVVTPICLAVVARTGSRGQLLAVLLAFAVAWPLARAGAMAWRVVLAPALIAILGIVAFASLQYFGADTERWNNAALASSDVTGRMAMAGMLLDKASDGVPTLVFGLGNSASYNLFGIYPHMVPLEVLGEEGLIGFALLVAAIVCCVLAVGRLRAMDLPADTRNAMAALVGATVFHFVVCFKQGSMLLNPLLFLHLILVPKLALAASSAANAAGPAANISSSPPPLPFPNLMRA